MRNRLVMFPLSLIAMIESYGCGQALVAPSDDGAVSWVSPLMVNLILLAGHHLEAARLALAMFACRLDRRPKLECPADELPQSMAPKALADGAPTSQG